MSFSNVKLGKVSSSLCRCLRLMFTNDLFDIYATNICNSVAGSRQCFGMNRQQT